MSSNSKIFCFNLPSLNLIFSVFGVGKFFLFILPQRGSKLKFLVSNRIPRINQLIKKELSQILLREIDFPQGTLATITRVETLSNLSESRIWVSVLPEGKLKITLEILNKNIYFLQQKLNKRLKMRPIPKIKFLEEKKTREAGQVEEILEKLKNKEK